jgi:hypothetical protein
MRTHAPPAACQAHAALTRPPLPLLHLFLFLLDQVTIDITLVSVGSLPKDNVKVYACQYALQRSLARHKV